jgi:hypothetical protein
MFMIDITPSPGSRSFIIGRRLAPTRWRTDLSPWERLTDIALQFHVHESGLARRHAQRGIEPHHLAVEVRIVDHMHRQRGKLVGLTEPARERDRCGE